MREKGTQYGIEPTWMWLQSDLAQPCGREANDARPPISTPAAGKLCDWFGEPAHSVADNRNITGRASASNAYGNGCRRANLWFQRNQKINHEKMKYYLWLVAYSGGHGHHREVWK
jgi:hypothetical protein